MQEVSISEDKTAGAWVWRHGFVNPLYLVPALYKQVKRKRPLQLHKAPQRLAAMVHYMPMQPALVIMTSRKDFAMSESKVGKFNKQARAINRCVQGRVEQAV